MSRSIDRIVGVVEGKGARVTTLFLVVVIVGVRVKYSMNRSDQPDSCHLHIIYQAC